jgi:hypothetical protein
MMICEVPVPQKNLSVNSVHSSKSLNSYLAVSYRGHEAAIVESLRAVVGVPKVLLEVLGGLVVAVGGVVELLLLLHVVSGSRHAAPCLQNISNH